MKKILSLFLLLVAFNFAQAQYSFSGTSVSNVSVGTVIAMTMTPGSSYNINFTSASQIASGVTVNSLNSFQVKSNMPWYIGVSAATANFTGTGTYASANMPSSVVSIGVSGQTAVALSTTNQTLLTGNRGNAAASGNTFSTNYTGNPGFGYGPGNYSITVNYTITYQ